MQGLVKLLKEEEEAEVKRFFLRLLLAKISIYKIGKAFGRGKAFFGLLLLAN